MSEDQWSNTLKLAIQSFDERASCVQSLSSTRGSILGLYQDLVRSAVQSTAHPEYCALQATWNQQVIDLSSKFVLDGSIGRDRMLSIGSFLGMVEVAYASVFKEVVCVDQDDYLLRPRPDNVVHHKADLDTASWILPPGRFNICFMVEILEHFLWSPIPLLKSLQQTCDMLVITTPDDREWPALPPRPSSRFQHFSAIPSAAEGALGNPNPMSHCKQYSQEEFVELLAYCGFRLVEFHRIGHGGRQMLALCTPRGG
jgi:hypothetical protein